MDRRFIRRLACFWKGGGKTILLQKLLISKEAGLDSGRIVSQDTPFVKKKERGKALSSSLFLMKSAVIWLL
jgi:hypothetical protein